MKKQHKSRLSSLERISIQVTNWVGTTQSIIVHTIFFIVIFGLGFFGISTDEILLILTTAVSLEAIYLALFIQMTVNRNTRSLEGVESDIDEIQEDVEDLGEDIDDIQENVEDLGEDIEDIQEDIDEIQSDGDDLDEHKTIEEKALASIEAEIKKIHDNIEQLKKAGILKES